MQDVKYVKIETAEGLTPYEARKAANRQRRLAVVQAVTGLSVVVIAAALFAVWYAASTTVCTYRRKPLSPSLLGIQKRQATRDEDASTTVIDESTTFTTDLYSTSTRSDKTEVYIFTTRPIINPGGYTVGSLTAYVRDSTANSIATPTPTPTPSPTPSPTTSEEPEAPTSAPTADEPGVPGAGVLAAVTLNADVPQPQQTPSEEDGSYGKLEGRSFFEVDGHLLHKRGLNFEEAEAQLVKRAGEQAVLVEEDERPTHSTVGKEEFSFSYNTAYPSETYTYVRTTRAILNPAGNYIGDLNGDYVPVPRTTHGPPTRPPTPPKKKKPTVYKPKDTAPPTPSPKAKAAGRPDRNELRRRGTLP